MSENAGGPRPPLALIAGPTASGKSDLAVRLALALRRRHRESVVINADSAQVYADLAVLSARPSPAEMQGVEHRLFGEWDGAEACSAADWAARAREVIAEVHARGAVPILVGGHSGPALRRAARLDGWIHGGGTDDLDELIERVKQLRHESDRADEPFQIQVISAEGFSVDGVRRLEDKGVTDVIVGFRWPYVVGADTEPLADKIGALERFAETTIAACR